MKENPSALPDKSENFSTFCIGDIAGSVGNFGTVIPLFFAVSLTTGMSLSLMLLICGGWYIITGLIYRIPIPVEPLKVIAAIAIIGGTTPSLIAAAGIISGVLFIILGLTGKMTWLARQICPPVIRGIQLGLGMILLRSAVIDFGISDIRFFLLGTGIVFLYLIVQRIKKIPDFSALTILCLGAGIMVFISGIPHPSLPNYSGLIIPNFSEYLDAGIHLVIPQIPLTLTNAILATSLLASELYRRPISPDRLSLTIGIMSFTSSILGGFPMCHGAGGVAAHFRFGARNGAAMIIGGIILIAMATLLTDPQALTAIPKGLFGALLLAVAVELIRHGMKTDDRFVTGLMGIIALPAGIVGAFLFGLIFVTGRRIWQTRFST